MCTFCTWCGALWWPFVWEAYLAPQTSNDSTFLYFLRVPPGKGASESESEGQKQLIMTTKPADRREKMLVIHRAQRET